MTEEYRKDRVKHLVPALWWDDATGWYWDVMDIDTGNLVGTYQKWTELVIDFPEFNEAMYAQ